MTLEERAIQDKVSSMSKGNPDLWYDFNIFSVFNIRRVEGLHRKISHDIMEVWKRNIRPLYDKEMEEISKSKETCGVHTRDPIQ